MTPESVIQTLDAYDDFHAQVRLADVELSKLLSDKPLQDIHDLGVISDGRVSYRGTLESGCSCCSDEIEYRSIKIAAITDHSLLQAEADYITEKARFEAAVKADRQAKAREAEERAQYEKLKEKFE